MCWNRNCAPKKGAHDFAQHLLTKAAERLRRGDYYCRRLGVHLSWIADLGGWWDETDFHETRDTGFCSPASRRSGSGSRAPNRSASAWCCSTWCPPMHQPDLFAVDTDRRQKLSPLVDRINDRYGRCSIGFGLFSARRARVQGPRRLSPSAGEVGILAASPACGTAMLG
jgi:hypothetical protein